MPVLILLLFIHCLLLLHLCEFCIGFLLCVVVIGVLSSLVNHLADEKRAGCFT